MEANAQLLPTEGNTAAGSSAKANYIRVIVFIIAAVAILFGAILLADGLADANNRVPGSGKRYMDDKEMAIAGAFIVSGGILVALSCALLRQRLRRKPTLWRTGLALGCGLLLSLALRGFDVRFNKPHWFTTNVPAKVPMGGDRYWDTEIRARALVESLNDMFRQNQ
ncbi:MAG: hypothetical protein JW810_06440 [Sedimentisphaerales bacterium]|nr:hypothetical protein [Sedimentisphaerales bacterium]